MKDTETHHIAAVNEDGTVEIPQELWQGILITPGEKVKIQPGEGFIILSKYEEKREETVTFSERDVEIREKIGLFLARMVDAVSLSNAEKDSIQFKGDLNTVNVSDILMFLNAAKKTGVLYLDLEGYKNVFFMVDGELYIALSTKPDEHLLEIFQKRKRISKKLAANIKNRAKEELDNDLNTAILECREIDTDTLLQVIRYQLEECVYALFMEHSGSFSFIDSEPPVSTDMFIPISLSNLVMEGARRVDEWSRIRKEIDSMDMVFERSANTDEINLEPDEREILNLVDGEKRVEDIIEDSGVEQFEVVHILYRLLSTNRIRKTEAAAPEEAEAEVIGVEEAEEEAAAAMSKQDQMEFADIISQYNNIFSTIYESVKFEIGEGASVVLGTFFKGLDQEKYMIFDGISIQEDGTLQAKKILKNMEVLPSNQRRKVLTDSLNELLYFQLFAVKNTIGTEMEQAILNIVKSQLKR